MEDCGLTVDNVIGLCLICSIVSFFAGILIAELTHDINKDP